MSKLLKPILSIILCLTIFVGSVPAFSADSGKAYNEIVSFNELEKVYLSPEDSLVEEYPNGAVILPVKSLNVQMDQLYAVDILRQGGTCDEIAVTLNTVDLTASYDVDYEIFINNNYFTSAVKGEANPYYAIDKYSFIPTLSETEVIYEAEELSEDTKELHDITGEMADAITEIMPVSSSLVLKFTEGENSKRIYVQTYKNKTVTDNLQFMLTLTDAEGCVIGNDNSTVFNILEEREKPQAYIQIADTVANPESDVVYVKVQRTGNLGGYTNFYVNTLSSSAKAMESYVPLGMNLAFMPGMTEIKVPVQLLDAKEDTAFEVELTDVTNAVVTKNTAQVSFSEKAQISEVSATSDGTASVGGGVLVSKTDDRSKEVVDLGKFKKSDYYDDNDDAVATFSDGLKLKYYNGISARNHSVSAVSPEKINFTGVDSITTEYDIHGGSCDWDNAAVYVGDYNRISSSDKDCEWMYNSLGGTGTAWDLTKIGDDYQSKTITLDKTKVQGEHNLYFSLHKGAFGGHAGITFYNDSNHKTVLNLTKYTVNVIDAEPVKIYKQGVLTSFSVVGDSKLVNPGASSDSTNNTSKEITMYRNETAALIGTYQRGYEGLCKLKGFYFCNPDKTEEHSELVSLSSSSFTLSTDYIEKYSKYFKGNKITIQPVYAVDAVEFEVLGGRDSVSGARFTTDNENCTAVATLDGKTAMEISWTKSEREDGRYYVGDEIVFTYKNKSQKNWMPAYMYRSAPTKDLLKTADAVLYYTSSENKTITLDNDAVSITPQMTVAGSTTLTVTNPEMGNYSGKGSKFETIDNGSAIVEGYEVASGEDFVFADRYISNLITMTATPLEGYRAKWQYQNVSTKETETYYGEAFYYTVQMATEADDNNVTLTFEPVENIERKTVAVTGDTLIQAGSVISPPVNSSEVYNIARNALVNMGGGSALSTGSGEFTISVDPNAENPVNKLVEISADETHQVAVYFNNQYFIADVDMSEVFDEAGESIDIDVKLPYKTYGVIPTSITATDEDGIVYNDTITLISAKIVNFDLGINRQGEDSDHPVNMVRWTVEGDNDIQQKIDVEIDKDVSLVKWGAMISELISPGEKLYVELFNKYYDKDANEQFKSYGKFDTGYTFVSTAVEESITYMPDIGADSTASVDYRLALSSDGEVISAVGGNAPALAHPIPCIGPISPTFSVKGFTPIFNYSVKKTEDGVYMNTVQIGFQLSHISSILAEDKAFHSVSAKDKLKKASDVLTTYFDAYNGDGPCDRSAVNLKTSMSVSFTATFCLQLQFYVDVETFEWRYVSGMIIAGATLGFRSSTPFVLLYVPCFVFFELNFNPELGMVFYPRTPATYLTAEELSNPENVDVAGIISIKLRVSLGLGMGFDGIFSASGSLINDFLIEWINFENGYGTYSLSGGISLEFLFLKANWVGKIVDAELFDTRPDDTSALSDEILAAVSEAFNSEDVMNTVSLRDMVLSNKGNIAGSKLESHLRSSVRMSEKAVISSATMVDPEIIEISDGVYFVATIMSLDTDQKHNRLCYMIYNSNTGELSEPVEVMAQLQQDSSVLRGSSLEDVLRKTDHAVEVTDCGDDILLVWNKFDSEDEAEDSLKLLKSLSIASVYYNKETGEFHDYDEIIPEEGTVFVKPSVAYNKSSSLAQIFYQTMDISSLTLDSTLSEIQQLPTYLETSCAVPAKGDYSWSEPEKVSFNEHTLSYYDAIEYKDGVLLSYVASDTTGFTLEGVDKETEIPEEYSGAYETVNAMYIQSFSLNEQNTLTANTPVQITDTDYVVANPEFVHINTDKVDNTLLFYKSNGRYAYQNIDTLLTSAVYTDENGNLAVAKDYMKPEFISQEPDYTINEDFKVYYNEDGTIYALWTTTEGEQQQIWARHFYIDGVRVVEEVPVRDESGEPVYDDDGNLVTEKLENPTTLLKGIWGGKAYLTEGGVAAKSDEGLYKSNFSADVLDNGNIMTFYNSCDYEYGENEVKVINNRFVIAEYDPKATYEIPDYQDIDMFSNKYPTEGETVSVTMRAKNTGVKTGRNLKFNLYVNDELYSETKVDTWLAEQIRTVTTDFTLPDGVDPSSVPIRYTVTDSTGAVVAESDSYYLNKGANLILSYASLTPYKYITDDNKTTKFMLAAKVKNIGNLDYAGDDVIKFVNSDLMAQGSALDDEKTTDKPMYTEFGSAYVPELKIGEEKTVYFMSEEISESVFTESIGGQTANLEFVIEHAEDADWQEIYADDEYGFISVYNPGLTQTPVPEKVKGVELQNVTVSKGRSTCINAKITPAKAAPFAELTYESSDTSVVTVNEHGIVTGVSQGSAVITVKAGDFTACAEVTVTKPELLLGDADLNGEVNIKDATAIQKHIAELTNLTEDGLLVSDVDASEKVNIKDATMIQKYVAGIVVKSPIGEPV